MTTTQGGAGRLRPHQPGEMLGDRFRVGKFLGQGGFGSVYEVTDTALNIRLACKEMDLIEAPPGLTGSRESFLESFLREAAALKTLHHPNIPTADYVKLPFGYQVCRLCAEPFRGAATCPRCHGAAVAVDHRHYLMMQFVPGETLEARYAKARPVPWSQAREWFLQIARAVAELHRNSLLHRDIKPENVLVDAGSGRAYLVDLGLVKVVRPVVGRMTRALPTGTQAIGSPGYAAPELYRAEAEPASDIFSLGMLLAWALSGRDPTDETQRHEILQSAPEELMPCAPPDVARAIAMALKPRPKDRHVTVDAFLAALEPQQMPPTQVLARDPAPLPMPDPASPRRSSGGGTFIVVVLLLALVGGTGWKTGLFRPLTTGSLTIESDPAGATVFWDGSRMGTTPLELKELSPGRIELRLTLEHYEPVTIHPLITAMQTTVQSVPLRRESAPPVITPTPAPVPTEIPTRVPTAEPTPTPTPEPAPTETAPPAPTRRSALVSITSVPAGAAVKLDGTYTGGRTPQDLDLTPGTHHIVLQFAGYDDWEGEVVAETGSSQRLDATLQLRNATLDTSTAQQVNSFVNGFVQKFHSSSLEDVRNYYDTQVDYLDYGWRDWSFIREDLAKLNRKYSSRDYQVAAITQMVNTPEGISVIYHLQFNLKSAAKGVAGTAECQMLIVGPSPAQMHIRRYKERILEKNTTPFR